MVQLALASHRLVPSAHSSTSEGATLSAWFTACIVQQGAAGPPEVSPIAPPLVMFGVLKRSVCAGCPFEAPKPTVADVPLA